MDKIDRELLDLLQNGLPIESHPLLALGTQLSIGEEEVIERIGMLKKKEYIRRIGGIFDSSDSNSFVALTSDEPLNLPITVLDLNNGQGVY